MKRLIWISLLALLFTTQISPAQAANGLVPKNALPSIMIGPKDIPWDVILSDFYDSNGKKDPLDIAGANSYTQYWQGPPIADGNSHRAYILNITVCITSSSAEAGQLAQKIVNNNAMRTPESFDKAYRTFSDRAWPHRSSILNGIRFCRRNVTVDMYMSYPGKDISHHFINICTLLGRKIDAAANGHPEPAPALPLINEKVHIGWRYPSVNKMLTKPAKNTIVLKCFNRDPVTVFARKLPGGDYMISLHAIALAMGDIKYIKAELNTGKAVIKRKPMTFTDGGSIVKIGKNKIDLAYPVEVSIGKSVNFPVSFIEKITGKHFKWKLDDKIMVGTIK